MKSESTIRSEQVWASQHRINAAMLEAQKHGIRTDGWILAGCLCLAIGLAAHVFIGHGDKAPLAPAADTAAGGTAEEAEIE